MLRKTAGRSIAFGCAIALAFAASPASATLYFITTGQAGAQTQIDVNHTSTWSINSTVAFDLGGGIFTMKDGTNTSANIVLTLYAGTDATGTQLQQLSLTNAQFDTLQGNSSSFNPTHFDFVTPFTFAANTDYFVALTSIAPDVQSQAYFIKQPGVFSVSDTSGTAPPGGSVTTTSNDVPEPASMALLGAGLVGLGLARRRRG